MPLPSLTNQHALSARSVHWISEVYGLGEVTGYEALATGYLNNNYRVETDRGRFFLKHHIKARRASLDEQHRLLGALKAAGVPVAAPLVDSYGRTYVTVSHRPVSAFQWIEGEHRIGASLTYADCEAVGALLGQAHRALAAIDVAAQQPFLLPPIRAEWTLARAEKVQTAIAYRESREPFDVLACEYLGFVIEQLRSAPAVVGDDPCVTPWQLTHGDFNPWNVLFGPDETLTIIDWDRVRVQPRLFELLRTLLLWLADDEAGSIDLEAARSMMRGYMRWVDVDVTTLPDVVEYAWWEKLNNIWLLTRHYLEADTTADDLVARTLGWLRWLRAHRHELAEVLADEARAAVSGGAGSPG
jgi:Ser/Thr protein kinase RdoA (MazF antagonist)